MPKQDLTTGFVKTATSNGKPREFYWDTALPGFGLMVTNNGARSYVIQYRNKDGKSRRMRIDTKSFAKARALAEGYVGQDGDVEKGKDPLADKRKKSGQRKDTLRRLVEDEYLPHKEVKKLRSLDEKKGTFERYIFPALGSCPITEIKRSDVIKMLEKVEERSGPGAANNAYKVLRRLFTWYVSRDDDFNSPIVHGVWTVSGGDGARALSDDEIRILWKVASEGRNAYDHFIRFCLLTATRLSEAAEMPRSELSPDGTEWTIPSKRYKGQDGKSAHAHLIPLSPLAREVLSAVPQLGSDYVFTGRGGKKPIAGFNELKKAFDQRLRATLEQEGERTYDQIIRDLNERYPGKGFQPFDDGWKTHSLRKTARTLLDRVGIDTRIAEKCLGHIQIGLLKTYNHHEAKPEKRTAFEALAREIERIVEGKRSNIIPLSRA